MGLSDVLNAVQASFVDGSSLRIARHGIREDATHYLIPVLDTRQMGKGSAQAGPSASRLLLVDKESGHLERVSVPDALARARVMRAVLPS